MIKNISLSSFQVFLTVAQCGSMSQAAKIHGMTPSGVSRMMDSLEKTLQAQLFDRRSSPIALTSIGRFLRGRCRGLLEAADFLEGDLISYARNQRLDLRIGTSTSVTRVFSPLLLNALTDRVNSISAHTGNTPKISRQLLDDEIDIAICSHALENSEFVNVIPLYTEEYLIILPKSIDHMIQNKADLVNYPGHLPCVQFGQQTLDSIYTTRLVRQWGIRRKNLYVDGIDSVLELVSHGKGWALMPTINILPGEKYFREVTFRRLTPQQGTRTIYLLYKNETHACIAREIQALIRQMWLERIAPNFATNYPIFIDSVSFFDQ